MPISSPWHLPVVMHYAMAIKPIRVLDIGVGMGAYGFMLRQYLDVAQERIEPQSWQTTIDGVEVFPRYENPTWKYAYSSVVIGDVRDVLPRLGEYDLAICADVLEHFPREEARGLVLRLLEKTPVLIATTPRFEYPQGAWAGNEAETHHCTLDGSDFLHLRASNVTGETVVYVSVRPGGPRRAVRRAALTCPTIKQSKIRSLAARIMFRLGI